MSRLVHMDQTKEVAISFYKKHHPQKLKLHQQKCCRHSLIDRSSPDVQCINTTTHCSSFPNYETSRTLWAVVKPVIIIIHTLYLTIRSHMQCERLSLCCVKSVHPLCVPSGNQLVLNFDSGPVTRLLWANKIWLEAFSLQSQELWLSCTVYSCWCDSSVLLSSLPCSSPFLFSSWAVWRSDFFSPPHCNTPAKPF